VHRATEGAFSEGFFLEHNLNRFSAEKEGHGGFFLLTPVMVLVGMLPLSILLFGPTAKIRAFFSQPLAAYGGIAVLVYVVFFSLSSTKLPNYPMPCYPMLSVVIGLYLSKYIQPLGRVPWYFWAVVLLVAWALPPGTFFALSFEESTRSLAAIAWIILVLPILLTGSLVWYIRAQVSKASVLFVITYAIFNFLALDVLYPWAYRQNIVSRWLTTVSVGNAKFIGYKMYNPAFNFNLPAPYCFIPVYNHPDSLKAGFVARQKHEPGNTIYIVTRQEYLGELDTVGFNTVIAGRDIFELPTTVVLTQRP
jgi:hypothetical protein